MFENQALEPRIFEDLERVRGSSTPNPGTIQGLTFNLFSILADQHLSANALFWITVWITALNHGPGTASRGSSFAAAASWTPTGVTGAGGWIWIELALGVGRRFGVVVHRTSGGDGWAKTKTFNFV